MAGQDFTATGRQQLIDEITKAQKSSQSWATKCLGLEHALGQAKAERDALKKEMRGQQASLATILGWGNVPPWDTLEREVVIIRKRLTEILAKAQTSPRPTVVCLCGSTRFGAAFDAANYRETLDGKIVLSIGCVTTSDLDLGITAEQKVALNELHKRKIDLADEVLVIDVAGYIGESTRNEIEYAVANGKLVRFLSEEQKP